MLSYPHCHPCISIYPCMCTYLTHSARVCVRAVPPPPLAGPSCPAVVLHQMSCVLPSAAWRQSGASSLSGIRPSTQIWHHGPALLSLARPRWRNLESSTCPTTFLSCSFFSVSLFQHFELKLTVLFHFAGLMMGWWVGCSFEHMLCDMSAKCK